ncbi:hypothetical protein [Georgenia yuyongxinii]|uniref:Uncharacterized protein n=1 Tax=Georgenia yuyongxinii TaxID=2589797 RepID=A0A552WQ57_9MICO|nr:hypothetical protein [Georgenia yuyongxinii]TRW44890.1 hypothetical protein FJ693_11790 [Georgenia yuyongxinii]
MSDETRTTVLPVPDGAPTAAAARRPRRWVAVVLAVLLVLTLAAGAYLAVLARAWSVRAGELDAVATDLGTRLAQSQADLDQRTSELGTAQSQLQASRDRIVELADEKAQTGDERETQRQLAEYQERVSAAAGSVASALQECVRGQEQLIGYLKDAELFDASALESFEAEVATFCDQAEAANADLQRELDR